MVITTVKCCISTCIDWNTPIKRWTLDLKNTCIKMRMYLSNGPQWFDLSSRSVSKFESRTLLTNAPFNLYTKVQCERQYRSYCNKKEPQKQLLNLY